MFANFWAFLPRNGPWECHRPVLSEKRCRIHKFSSKLAPGEFAFLAILFFVVSVQNWAPGVSLSDSPLQTLQSTSIFVQNSATRACFMAMSWFCRFCSELGPGNVTIGFSAKNYTGYTNSRPNWRQESLFDDYYFSLLSSIGPRECHNRILRFKLYRVHQFSSKSATGEPVL